VKRGADASSASPEKESVSIVAARKLDALLRDGVQDLGLTLDISEQELGNAAELSDLEVITLAAKVKEWLIVPTVQARGSDLVVRIVAVPPGSDTALVRSEVVKTAELPVRAAVMLRDIVAKKGIKGPSEAPSSEPPPAAVPRAFAVRSRSQGRATLALNAALFGGFIGYSIQRASNSDDPRILYPLMALGTGMGLGVSAIVAEEWDVGLGDAWYLSAAAWWPALSGFFLARSVEDSEAPTQYGSALIGSGSGLGLATVALVLGGGMGEGGALLTHSGGAFGTFLGGMTELAIRGTTEGAAPYRGLGYGAAAGVLLAGALAPRVEVGPSPILVVDLGAGLGALAGAAVTSPFIFKSPTVAGYRAFLLATMGSTLAGGAVAWFGVRRGGGTASPRAIPYAGIIGESYAASGAIEPVLGVGVRAALP
jgi:hypothetical protein